eukprot:3007809-Prorocentrum_lima.AAC.1
MAVGRVRLGPGGGVPMACRRATRMRRRRRRRSQRPRRAMGRRMPAWRPGRAGSPARRRSGLRGAPAPRRG